MEGVAGEHFGEKVVGVQLGLGHLGGFAPDHEGFRGLFG